MAEKLNAHEKQAKLSLLLAGISILFAVGLTGLIFRNFHAQFFEVIYDANGRFYPIILATIAVAGITSAIGFLIGLNSAGQKRNTLSKLSWQGFFVNAIALTLTLCMALFFFLTKLGVQASK